jgi:phage terminase large subunit-like protein
LTEIERICREGSPGYDPWRDADGWEFDAKAAQLGVDFFHEELTFADGKLAGKPFLLERWQQSVVGNIYGWNRGDERRYREVFIYVPRKNGKTPLAAGLMVQELVRCQTPGAQMFSAAADRDQAALIFRDATQMVRNQSWINDMMKVTPSYKTIEKSDFSLYKALSSEAGTKHGLRPALVIVDELHAHPNSELVDTLTTGTAVKGLEPLIVYITTADYERESVCNTKHRYACSVRDGKVNDARCFPVIFEAAIDDDWKDPEVWKRVNPNYGVSVSEDYLARACERAQVERSFENEFKRLHLNIKTQSIEAWLPMDRWDQCPSEAVYLDGETCYGGLDMSSTQDITAFVLYFPELKAVRCWFWLPGDNAEVRQRRDGVPYSEWLADGVITETPGDYIEQDPIFDSIMEANDRYDIRKVGADGFQAAAMIERLMREGIDIEKFPQTMQHMTSPCKSLEKLVGTAQLNHGGNPALRWMAGNCVVEREPKRSMMRPSKKHSSEKIDGITALVTAVGTAEADEQEYDWYKPGSLAL